MASSSKEGSLSEHARCEGFTQRNIQFAYLGAHGHSACRQNQHGSPQKWHLLECWLTCWHARKTRHRSHPCHFRYSLLWEQTRSPRWICTVCCVPREFQFTGLAHLRRPHCRLASPCRLQMCKRCISMWQDLECFESWRKGSTMELEQHAAWQQNGSPGPAAPPHHSTRTACR